MSKGQTPAEELRTLRGLSVALAATCIYLDPTSNAPDSETRMYCSHCSNYGDPGAVFLHKPDCLVGLILAGVGNHVVDPKTLPDRHIEYSAVKGQPSIRMTHHQAAEAKAREQWGGGR